MFLIMYVRGGKICSYLEEHSMNFEEKFNILFNLRWQIEHPIFLNTYFYWILGGIKGYSFDNHYEIFKLKCVREVIEILEEEFLNPLGVDLEQDKGSVYNLSSGQKYQGSADDLVGIRTIGQALYNDFKKGCLFSTTIKFHDTIKLQKPTLFSDVSKSKPKKDTNYEVVKANWNVLGKLLALSANAQ